MSASGSRAATTEFKAFPRSCSRHGAIRYGRDPAPDSGGRGVRLRQRGGPRGAARLDAAPRGAISRRCGRPSRPGWTAGRACPPRRSSPSSGRATPPRREPWRAWSSFQPRERTSSKSATSSRSVTQAARPPSWPRSRPRCARRRSGRVGEGALLSSSAGSGEERRTAGRLTPYA